MNLGDILSSALFPLFLYFTLTSIKRRGFRDYRTWAVITPLFMSARDLYELLIYWKLTSSSSVVELFLRTLSTVSAGVLLVTFIQERKRHYSND